jgi:hypothetical protein
MMVPSISSLARPISNRLGHGLVQMAAEVGPVDGDQPSDTDFTLFDKGVRFLHKTFQERRRSKQ